MSGSKKVIIIGSGVGGITTAIHLARKGYQVKIFEKNSYPGGRCGKIIKDGHRFDIADDVVRQIAVFHAKTLNRPPFGDHAVEDARPFEGRSRRAGAGEHPILVAKHHLTVGTHVDEERQLFALGQP